MTLRRHAFQAKLLVQQAFAASLQFCCAIALPKASREAKLLLATEAMNQRHWRPMFLFPNTTKQKDFPRVV